MIELFDNIDAELKTTKTAKSSFDFPSIEGKIFINRLAASYGLTLAGLTNELYRKALIACLEDVAEINDEERLEAMRIINRAFPERRSAVVRNLLMRVNANRSEKSNYIWPTDNMTEVYNRIKAMDGLLPVGKWTQAVTRPTLDAVYQDEVGNVFDIGFKLWNPLAKRFMNAESLPTDLIRKAFNEGWKAQSKDDPIYDLSPAFKDRREEHFPSEVPHSTDVVLNYEDLPLLS